MKDTRPTMEQLFSLTAKQRKTILIYGISVIVISLIIAAVFVTWYFGELNHITKQREKAWDMDIFYVAGYLSDGEPIELIDDELEAKRDRKLEKLDEDFQQLMITSAIVAVVWLGAVGGLYLVQRKCLPYYTEKRFYGMLGAVLKGTKFPANP